MDNQKIQDLIDAKKQADQLSEYITEDIDQADEWLELAVDIIEQQQREIERLQRDIAFITNHVPTTGTEILIRERIQEEAKRIERLQVERDKAIEGLRWYAGHPFRSERTALNVLSELGVPHETT